MGVKHQSLTLAFKGKNEKDTLVKMTPSLL